MYNLIYNPINCKSYSINSKNGKKILKNFLNKLFGGEIVNNKHYLKSSKVRLIFEGPEKFKQDNKEMVEHITNWQWNMYNTDSKNKNSVRFCTYGLHFPFCPEYGINGTMTGNDKVTLDITPNLEGIYSRAQKPEKVNFKLYVKDIKNNKPLERLPYYWELNWKKKCYNSK